MDNYVVLEHIGEGSFGKVYKARRKNTGFTVAMKFITKHGKSEKDLKNLRQEIRILRKLNHENIILMFDTFETEREFCVVTEYGQGELFDILQVIVIVENMLLNWCLACEYQLHGCYFFNDYAF